MPDVFVFSGPIYQASVNQFIDMIREKDDRSESASLVLTSYGGNPHDAFRMARALSCYQRVRVLIAGQCKSAGTLVALAAHEIAFGPWGELGPLDAQIRKPDEIQVGHSGLDALEALSIITENGYTAFHRYVLDLTEESGMSTKFATETAASLVSGFFQPIAAQIDPYRLGETTRAIAVAKDYGTRLAAGTLNLKAGALDRLINEYSTHWFAIDKTEAETLFERVEELTPPENELVEGLEEVYGQIRYPTADLLILDVARMAREEGADERSREGSLEPTDGTEQGSPREEGEGPSSVAGEDHSDTEAADSEREE